jgi:hypothetical protein
LKTLDNLEKKVDIFESDLTKMWLNIHEQKGVLAKRFTSWKSE